MQHMPSLQVPSHGQRYPALTDPAQLCMHAHNSPALLETIIMASAAPRRQYSCGSDTARRSRYGSTWASVELVGTCERAAHCSVLCQPSHAQTVQQLVSEACIHLMSGDAASLAWYVQQSGVAVVFKHVRLRSAPVAEVVAPGSVAWSAARARPRRWTARCTRSSLLAAAAVWHVHRPA